MVQGDNGIEKFNRIHNMIKIMADNPAIDINQSVYRSEKLTGNTNRAIAYYLKGAGLIEKDVEDVLDTYFKLCSIEVTALDVAKMASVVANNGITPWSNERLMSIEICRIVKAIMTTCGLYDSSGQFSVEVGLPSKSGVGGGICSVVPGKMGIGVYGPSLDKKGNSIAGVALLEDLSSELNLTIFYLWPFAPV